MALSNSMRLWAMPCRATQNGRIMMESSDRKHSTGEGNGKPRQYSCFENSMNSMKRQTKKYDTERWTSQFGNFRCTANLFYTHTHTHTYMLTCSVTQSCLSLCNPMDCSLPDSSVIGIFQARILEWVAISYSSGPSRPRDWTHVSCLLHWQADSLPYVKHIF